MRQLSKNSDAPGIWRRLSVSEMVRLQGASPERLAPAMKRISKAQLGKICGNAMSVSVVKAILKMLLPSVGLTLSLS
eukprot:4265061-Karenia_brevis.AAC.1